jgi:hypothetical protein
MKKMYLLMIVAFLVAVSCTKDDANGPGTAPVKVEKENYIFLKNAGLYGTAEKKRSEEYSSPFEIMSVRRSGNTMDITVSFQAGCGINQFEVIWDGLIMESYPVQTRIFVKRNASGCAGSEETETMVLSVDLKELIFEGNDPQLESAVITVSNSSKKTGTQNADVAASDKN